MENMGNYYKNKHNVDFRSLRYPGVISPYEYESHGTTDYASEIFFSAIKKKDYKICLSPETALPMAYLDDIIDGTIQFMESEVNSLSSRVYNVQGLSFSCEELASALAKHYHGFTYRYEPDFRDKIAKNWPQSIDDTLARKDWNWDPKCKDVDSLISIMKENIRL
jgi:threonine 3-dehydrogenase